VKGRITQVVRSPHCPEGRMYMVNERLLLLDPPEDDPRIGIIVVVWDDDAVVAQAQTMIGKYVEVGEP
jgi:hypothetical protein